MRRRGEKKRVGSERESTARLSLKIEIQTAQEIEKRTFEMLLEKNKKRVRKKSRNALSHNGSTSTRR
jgi:hypothetical protein